MARKHAESAERNLNRCELCEKVFETVKEMKKHLQTHSYKKANFKCVDCEFVGTNEETMEVHIGKTHADIFECGLCGYEVETLEKLDIHLFTCEVYICSKCDFLEKSLSEVKSIQRMNILLNKIFKFTIDKWIKETMVKSSATLIAGTKM